MASTRRAIVSTILIVVAAFSAQGCMSDTSGSEAEEGAQLSAAPASLNGARIMPLTEIVDASRNVWTVTFGVVYKNGEKAGLSSGVQLLLYFNGKMYQNVGTGWWSWTGTNWAAAPSDPRITSADDTEITSSSYLTDGSHNIWIISGGVVYENGATAGTTADVIDLVYANGHIWQKNSFQNWYEWNGSSWPASASPIGTSTTSTVPPGARAGGYATQALNSDFTTLPLPSGSTTAAEILGTYGKIDIGSGAASTGGAGPGTPGYDWYLNCPICSTTEASALSIRDDNGTHVLRLDGTNPTNILGQSENRTTHEALGKGYSNGAYFEARIAMAQPASDAKMWPQFVAFPNFSGIPINWPGSESGSTWTCADKKTMTGDFHTDVEIDTLELLPSGLNANNASGIASATAHSWYGVYDCTDIDNVGTAHRGYSQNHAGYKSASTDSVTYASTPENPIFNTFGVLWVPATPTTEGYLEFYYNDQPLGEKITWTGKPPTTSDPATLRLPNGPALANTWLGEPNTEQIPSWAFGATDLYPYAVGLGTGGGAFMDVQWVRVWQR